MVDPVCEVRVLRKAIGASRVISWNSTVRRNEPEKVKMKDVPKQQGPEKGFVPTSRLQPVAGVAHIDQDDVSHLDPQEFNRHVGLILTYRCGGKNWWARQPDDPQIPSNVLKSSTSGDPSTDP